MAEVSKIIATFAVATAFRVLYWWKQQCKQISNGRLEIFIKIITLLIVTVLVLFTFFNLILDAPRKLEPDIYIGFPVVLHSQSQCSYTTSRPISENRLCPEFFVGLLFYITGVQIFLCFCICQRRINPGDVTRNKCAELSYRKSARFWILLVSEFYFFYKFHML